MILYQLNKVYQGEPQWHGTRDEARKAARQHPEIPLAGILISQYDVPVDKEGVLGILNHKPGTAKLMRQWEFSNRGGLVELGIPDEDGTDQPALQVYDTLATVEAKVKEDDALPVDPQKQREVDEHRGRSTWHRQHPPKED
jgi:hypothetical protein